MKRSLNLLWLLVSVWSPTLAEDRYSAACESHTGSCVLLPPIGGAPDLAAAYKARIAGDLDLAVRLSSSAIDKGLPTEHRALGYTTRGDAYHRMGDAGRAISDFTQALRLDPNNAEAYIGRGEAYVQARATGDVDRAISDFQQVLRLDPAADRYAKHQAEIDLAIVQSTSALDDDNSLAATRATAYIARGHAYNEKGDAERAIGDFSDALRLDPSRTEAYIGRGRAYSSKNDYERATSDLTAALRLSPDAVDAYRLRGVARHNHEDYGGAVKDYTEVLRLDPDDAEAYHGRGLSASYNGDYDNAISDLSEALRLAPRFAARSRSEGEDPSVTTWSGDVFSEDLYGDRAYALYLKGDYDRAIDDATEALRLEKDSNKYKIRGYAYFFQGQFQSAIEDFDNCLTHRIADQYCLIWRYLARERAAQEGVQELSTTIAAWRDAPWPYPILRYFMGGLTRDQLMIAAGNAGPEAFEPLCDVAAYLGEYELLHGNQDAAQALFRAAVTQCSRSNRAHKLAAEELRRQAGPH